VKEKSQGVIWLLYLKKKSKIKKRQFDYQTVFFCDIIFHMKTDTIVATATAAGIAGVAIIRLSGPQSLEISNSFFKVADKKIEPRFLHLGEINEPTLREKCPMVYFKAPNSFTGEDVVEIHCHGGTYITSAIIDLSIRNGARLAEPGEFSKRAFVNGKMSLDSAEGIVDLINSQTATEVKASFSLASGLLFKTVTKMQETLTDCIAEIEVNFDYPEHDIEYETAEGVSKKLKEVEEKLLELSSTQATGRLLKDGVNVLILGRPNVGKSSLLNALLNYERAIVTDIAGTTRDTISDTYIYKDIRFHVTDTAGLRKSKNKIEKIGIERAKALLDSNDIILLVLDANDGILPEDLENMKLIENHRRITVINKCDLKPQFNCRGKKKNK
jgi:tRNA modification GTPase